MALPPIDKIVENVTGQKPVQEERTDTLTVFSKDKPPQVYKGTDAPKKDTEIKPEGNCSSYWVRMHFAKEGQICYNTCNKVISCDKS